jgi:hypothetical protein
MRGLNGGTQTLLVVAAAAIIGSGFATGAFAGHKHVPRWPISAFSHPLRRAHGAGATTPRMMPGVSGASLAAVKGSVEIWIGHRYSPTTLACFWERTPSGGGGGGCGRPSELEAKGAVSLYEANEHARPRILAWVPDGVASVVVTDSDRSSHTVAVTNNFAVYDDLATPSSVSYTLPNGATETTNVSAWRTPLRPGAPGSSE